MVDGVLNLVLEDFQIELVSVTVLAVVAQRELGYVFCRTVAVGGKNLTSYLEQDR